MSEDLQGYEVVVGVCGGIAAYKTCTVVSELVQQGVGVSVVMTRAATKLIGPPTFEALTARQVFTSLWKAPSYFEQQHIQLTERADLLLVAPATANIIGKAAGGICDDLLSTMILSADCPILFAPTMNSRMWANPILQENLEKLQQLGHCFVGPAEGWLACRTTGAGRMAEPADIIDTVVHQLELDPPRMRSSELGMRNLPNLESGIRNTESDEES